MVLTLILAILSWGSMTWLRNESIVHAQAPARLEVWDPVLRSSNITDLSRDPPDQFVVFVNVTGAGLINGFDVTLSYDWTGPGVLDAVAGSLGGGLFDPDNPPSPSCSVFVAKQDVDIPQGRVRFAAVFFGPCSVDGNGTLFSVIFDVKKVGATSIDIVQTNQIGDPASIIASSGRSVPYQAINAYFRNKPGIPPIARFSHSPLAPVRGDVVLFNATLSYDPSNSTRPGIKSYVWNFGDGTLNSEGPIQNHIFFFPPEVPGYGNFSVTLVVTDFDDDLPSSLIVVVNVSQASFHDLSVSVFFDKTQYLTGEPVQVSTVVTNHGINNEMAHLVVSYDYPNRTVIVDTIENVLAGQSINSFFLLNTTGLPPRTYTVLAQVTVLDPITGEPVQDANPFDNTSRASFNLLSSANMLPVAIIISNPSNPVAGDFVFFDGSRSFDPDGFVTNWFWDFGDGFFAPGSQVYHSFFAPGDYTVTLAVTDNMGASSTASVAVHVIPRPAHDVGIVSLDANPRVAVSSQFVSFVVLLTNRGVSSENVSLTVYYDSQAAVSLTGIILYPQPYPQYFFMIWDTAGVLPGDYTISATVFLASDENPSDNSLTDGIVTILPPPTLSATPSSGTLGTKVTVQGTGFPSFAPSPGPGLVFMSFDDMFMGFATTKNGQFSFTFNVPHAETGVHSVKAFDTLTGVRASTSFTVAGSEPTPKTGLAISVDVGSIYFPGDTADIYVLVQGSRTDATVQLTLFRPDGTSITLNPRPIGEGLYKASFAIPRNKSLGTYALVAKIQQADGQASALKSFEVKQSWLSEQGPRIASATAIAGVLGVVVVAWRMGYLKRKDETTSLV